MKITTHRSDNNAINGYLIPIWNALDDPDLRPDQVYVTTVAPYSKKGPHLHLRRGGFFTCISGAVVIATRSIVPVYRKVEGLAGGVTFDPNIIEGYRAVGTPNLFPSSAMRNLHQRVLVPTGMPCAIYNPEGKEAVLLNLPSKPWSAEDPDEHVVLGWEDPPIGKLLELL